MLCTNRQNGAAQGPYRRAATPMLPGIKSHSRRTWAVAPPPKKSTGAAAIAALFSIPVRSHFPSGLGFLLFQVGLRIGFRIIFVTPQHLFQPPAIEVSLKFHY
jgi:hypothetical protein